jgi:hypothetical protein
MPGVSETRTYDVLLTTTLANYREKMYDNVFDVFPTLSYLNGKLGEALKGEKRLRLLDGGESIVEHVMYEASSAVKSYSNYESLDTTPQEGATIARYSWRQYAATVSISGLERRNNSGESKMIDILKFKIMQAEMSLRDRLSRDVWGTAVGGADGKSLDGLGIIVDSTGTLGGLSAASFSVWAATERAGGSFAATGLNDMRVVFNTISWGNETPDYITAPQAVFEFFESTLQPQERYTNTKSANVGFTNLTFKGVPFIFDRDCIAGNIFMLRSSAINLSVHRDANMSTGKFIEPENQDATTAKILFQGNLTTPERRRHGKITGITA